MKIRWFSLVRITGLLLVLCYHFFKATFSGGFIGVDVFFTFSGYLITALMLDEFAETNAFSLKAYLRRRFYRIFPPLLLMVALVLPFTLMVKSDFRAGIVFQLTSALGFVTNFYEIFTGSSYESQFIPHLFVHTWSLAIEGQFYVLWAVLIYFLSKNSKALNQFRGSVFLISLSLFLVSFLSMFSKAFFIGNVSNIYYSSLSHSFPFFAGAILATLTGVKYTTRNFDKSVAELSLLKILAYFFVGFIGLMTLGFFLKFDAKFTYLIGFLLATICAGSMIYATRIFHELSTINEPRLISYLAEISYGIYLFHWPFYVIFSQLMSNILAVFLTLLLSIIFSTISYYVIEPWIIGRVVRFWGFGLDFKNYLKPIKVFGVILSILTLGILIFSPKMGDFEEGLLISSLQQSQTGLNRLNQQLAGDSDAQSDVLIIGDSVALRAEATFTEDLSDASLDASVSRNFSDAFEIFKDYGKNLPKTIVIAVGVNSTGNYQKDVDQFVESLPKGHRLIFVSPYNSKDLSAVKLVRDYELDLASKNEFVTVADWYAVSKANPDIWIDTDGVHFSQATTKGSVLYVSTIKDAIKEASKKSSK